MFILVGGLFGLMLVPALLLMGPFLVWLLVPLAVLAGGGYFVGASRTRHLHDGSPHGHAQARL